MAVKRTTSIKSGENALLLKAFGARLKKLRLAKGITPQQLSKKLGIDRETLRKYEDGRLEPKLVLIDLMAKTLRVSQRALLDADTTI